LKEITISDVCIETVDGVRVVVARGVTELDIHKTFDCGQSFRFERVENSAHECEYSGVAFGRLVSFAQDGDTLYVYNSDIEDFQNIWTPFLGLDTDYGAISADIMRVGEGTVLERAEKYGRGIRILRQDAFEAVISFIISQNNNIPRIKKIIEAMSAAYGEQIEVSEGMRGHITGSAEKYSFPTIERLAGLDEQELRELKMGFRASYVLDAATKIHGGELDLDALARLSTDECIEALQAVKGIGVKVASCAALFGMGKYDAFPIDVWIKRVAEKYFADDKEPFCAARFGEYAGIAQQYLFYYERYLGGE
jgi:N-glycosylase/DNA lyase